MLFGFEIIIYLDHTNLVYTSTNSEFKIVIHWKLIIKYFGTHTPHIDRVENIVADMISRLTYTSASKYESITKRYLS